MAVANPCLQKEWGEWKRGMEKSRRIRLQERIRRWSNVEVSKEEDSVETEEEDEDEVKEEVEKEVTGESDDAKVLHVEEEEVKVREVQENEEEESEHENNMGDEEEDKEVSGRDENYDVEEEVDEERVTDEVDEEEVKALENGGEEVVEGVEKEVHEEQVDEQEGENKVEKDEEEIGDEGEEEVRQVSGERKEEEQEEEEEEEELQEQNLLAERFQVENVQQNRESPVEEDEEHNFSDSEEGSKENSNFTGYKTESFIFSERLKDEKQSGDRCGNELSRAWSTPNESEDDSEKMTVTESWTTQEDFHDDILEEDSTDDGEAECLVDEDEDGDDDDKVKIYCKDDYPANIFCTLDEFRGSGLLTDLTLNTEDGTSFLVHSPIVAAVSSLIWKNLSRNGADERQDDVGHMWCLTLEVDHVGLEAIVEFAYTGLISRLNKDNVEQIKAAAQTLSAPRVLSFCRDEEEASSQPTGKKKKKRISAEQQLRMSLQSIKRLWVDKVGCDVILEALGGSLHVHRVILAVSSDYFRSMFTLGMKESHQPCVSLPFLLASELKILIDCSYSGVLPLTWSCVFEITSTALQLQYQPALSLCLNFLQKELNPDSCLDVVAFAEAYDMVELLEVADDFVLRQFQKVACTLKFKDLPAKQLFKYLNSRSLCVPSELVVFRAVVAWIQTKPKKRLRLAKELMKTIHFPLMTFKEFKEVQSQDMWSDHSLAELYEAVFEDFCSNEITVQNQCRVYLPKESLVLIGGDQISEDLGSRSISRELWFGNSLRNHTGIRKAMEWRKLGEMPEPARFCHEVAVLNGTLYVFGGKKYYGIGDTLNSVYRTAGSAWLKCRKREALSQWSYLMERYTPSVDIVTLTTLIL
ncbi:uncharacterized protein LOC114435857 isoform X2 [Parambassis ranga]|uniref:Uncharacterized protein LOC114435857 isoform X2 n=1 Tax=Parambassis ranga TaxID=210632 RepID=A0A6P7IMG4_9TELE|nr:uncharacterized protein LOC114435857 isoform X2 [Parambassis ranga]